MKYREFCRLLGEGEQAHIDFKVRCDAFNDSKVASRGELAKDICAMANNGYRASYIVVGVSDDGQSFRSVDNPKLTDDNLQDFCKKAIFPPPKVKVHREEWKRASVAHQGKVFVVIQVGPNRRQAFRLAQDFVNYDQRVCYRRNEVWIRRNATSDLATPEEIARLVSGKSPYEDPKAEEKRAERRSFASLSQSEQKALINAETEKTLKGLGYDDLPDEDWFRRHSFGGGEHRFKTLWKKTNSTVILACVLSCRTTLTTKELEEFHLPALLGDGLAPYDVHFAVRDVLLKTVSAFTRRRVKAVRRICLVPVIRSVPASRIAQALPSSRRIGSLLHYYRPRLLPPSLMRDKKGQMLPSSSEIFVISGIYSLPEYTESLERAIKQAESQAITLVSPEK